MSIIQAVTVLKTDKIYKLTYRLFKFTGNQKRTPMKPCRRLYFCFSSSVLKAHQIKFNEPFPLTAESNQFTQVMHCSLRHVIKDKLYIISEETMMPSVCEYMGIYFLPHSRKQV